jgi:hypothetical protein
MLDAGGYRSVTIGLLGGDDCKGGFAVDGLLCVHRTGQFAGFRRTAARTARRAGGSAMTACTSEKEDDEPPPDETDRPEP